MRKRGGEISSPLAYEEVDAIATIVELVREVVEPVIQAPFELVDIEYGKTSLRGPRSDVAVLATTFLLTVLFDLTIAIELGLLFFMLLFMRRMVESTKILVSRKGVLAPSFVS